MVASVGDLLLDASQRIDDVDPAAVALGAEDDARAIGRKGRNHVVGSIARKPHGLASGDLLNPDVGVPLAAAIRGVGSQLAVGGDCGIRREAGVEGKPRGLEFHRRLRASEPSPGQAGGGQRKNDRAEHQRQA